MARYLPRPAGLTRETIHLSPKPISKRRIVTRRWVSLKDIKTDISVIIPVLNESENIEPLVKRLSNLRGDFIMEVLFVDDSIDSLTDDTIVEVQKKFGRPTFMTQSYHRTGRKQWGGLSGAVTDGILRAKSDLVVVMDGDLQHPPETIPSMVEAMNDSDLVVASRYRDGGSAEGLDGTIRHLVSRGSTLATKVLFPLRLRKVSDPMTGFFMLNRKLLNTKLLHPKGFKILLEILATHPSLRVSEVPLEFAERHAGKSHGDLKQGINFLSQLIDLRLRSFSSQLFSKYKFLQFAFIGGTVFGLGMLLLYLLVDVFKWSPLVANALQLGLTFWLNYYLNKKITWSERIPCKASVEKFLISRTATTILNYLMFVWLISLQLNFSSLGINQKTSINYLVANVVTLIAMTAINYIVSDRWVFAEHKPSTKKNIVSKWQQSSSGYAKAVVLFLTISCGLFINPTITIYVLIAVSSIALLLQSSFEVWRTSYSFRQPESVDKLQFPALRDEKSERFCLIVPARHESAVLGDTLLQLAEQSHPNVDIIAVVCSDDIDTLDVAHSVARQNSKVSVVEFPLLPNVKPSKPKQMNYVFNIIKSKDYTVVGVIDAEDSVHPDLLVHVDAAFHDKTVGIVQGGVQLMNHHSSWYALHNVLEYYRFFNSTMAYQASQSFVPLGGNTVFVRLSLLKRAGGWPDTLTEDCSLGVLLSSKFHTKTAVYYEPSLATREETPDSLVSLFNQRVRWNQGFFQEWRKGVWRKLPTNRQRLLADYVLIGPVLLAVITAFIPISILTAIFIDAPVMLVLLAYLPMIPIGILISLNVIFLHDFSNAYNQKVKPRHYAVLLISQIPYQLVLNAAALWAVIRELRGESSWYKTSHTGLHRTQLAYIGVSNNS